MAWIKQEKRKEERNIASPLGCGRRKFSIAVSIIATWE